MRTRRLQLTVGQVKGHVRPRVSNAPENLAGGPEPL